MPAPSPSLTPHPTPRLTAAIGQTLALLSLTPAELGWRLAVEAAKNPALRPVRPPLTPPVPGWHATVPDPGGLTAPDDSLIAHILHQIGGLDLSPRERAIALALTEALEPTGWLGMPASRLARSCGLPEAEVLGVLARLQRIEPGGLFARSLAECLRLQAEQAGEMSPDLALLLEHLPLLASGGAEALTQPLGLPPERIAELLRQIRGYDPKPGLAFGSPVMPLPPADLLLRRTGAIWEAVPNPNSFALEVDATHPGRAAAEALRRAVEGRLRIALAIGALLAERQHDWLEGGQIAVVTARQLADATGFHISTINRALAAITARTPFGTKPLRSLVSHDATGTGISSAALREQLRALIAAAGDTPVSDATLTAQLAEKGIHTARRTVCKYRLALSR